MNVLLDDLQTMEHQKQQHRDVAFQELVNAIASGERSPTDDVSARLAASGRTVDDLRAAVRQRQEIERHRLAIRQAAEAKAEIRALREQIAVADSRLEDSKREHDAAVRPLRHQIEALTKATRRAVEARAALRKNPPPHIAAELQEHRAKMADFERQELSLKARLHQARNNLVSAVEQTRPDVANFAENVDAIEAALKSLRDSKAEFAAIEAEIFERLYAGD